jgi:hypothetical protein
MAPGIRHYRFNRDTGVPAVDVRPASGETPSNERRLLRLYCFGVAIGSRKRAVRVGAAVLLWGSAP